MHIFLLNGAAYPDSSSGENFDYKNERLAAILLGLWHHVAVFSADPFAEISKSQ
tara:strand:+ start:138 stop:299 length:162 start_codon:yes stop_codon:yes gene_type:complete